MKSDRSKVSQKAVSYHLEGYNCAQSVLLAMFENWNGKNELIPKVATAFGGGIGRSGSVCGALTGGVIFIGAKYGTNNSSAEERAKAYDLANRFYSQFKTRNGSVLCRELIGYDLSNPEEMEKARKANVFHEKCSAFVESAVEILLEISEEQQ